MGRMSSAMMLLIAMFALAQTVLGFGGGTGTRLVRPVMTMKIFDWQRREAFETFTIPDGMCACGRDMCLAS